jgi:ribosomal protein L20
VEIGYGYIAKTIQAASRAWRTAHRRRQADAQHFFAHWLARLKEGTQEHPTPIQRFIVFS